MKQPPQTPEFTNEQRDEGLVRLERRAAAGNRHAQAKLESAVQILNKAHARLQDGRVVVLHEGRVCLSNPTSGEIREFADLEQVRKRYEIRFNATSR